MSWADEGPSELQTLHNGESGRFVVPDKHDRHIPGKQDEIWGSPGAHLMTCFRLLTGSTSLVLYQINEMAPAPKFLIIGIKCIALLPAMQLAYFKSYSMRSWIIRLP
jgi:hypothetical protein